MAKSTQQKQSQDIARAYADRLVLQGIANVESTLRLGDLAAKLSSQGINLAALRNLLATNPDRFTYADRRWLPAARVASSGGPVNQHIKLSLESYGAPMKLEDLAGELSRSHRFSREYFEKRLPAMLESDPELFCTPSGYAGLAKWLFMAEGESQEVATYHNGLDADEIDESKKTLGRIDYSNPQRAAQSALKYAPISPKLIGFFAWRQLNPQEDYAHRLYDAVEIFDALLTQPGFVYGADGKFHPDTEAPKWLKQALKEAEKAKPSVVIEEAAPLEFGDVEVSDMVRQVLASPISVSVGRLLEQKYELTPADRTYPEDLANAIAALEQSSKVWYVGGDRFRKPESAPEFIYTVPEFFNYTDYDFRDEDGEPIDLELSDDAFTSALRKEMLNPLAQDVLDEDPQPKAKKMPEQLRLVLKSLHRELGTFPLCQIPPGWLEEEPRVQEVIFRDPKAVELNVWVNHDARLMFNLIDWWFAQPIESGSVFTLTKTEEPNVFDFEWLEETDPLLYISSQRMEELRDLAARSAELSTYEILIEVLSHYNKGADYLTILAETNVVRRVTRRLVASLLTGYHAFYQRAGSPVWHFDQKKVDQGFDKTKRKYVRG